MSHHRLHCHVLVSSRLIVLLDLILLSSSSSFFSHGWLQHSSKASLVSISRLRLSNDNNNDRTRFPRTTPSEEARPFYPKRNVQDKQQQERLVLDTAQRPGAIIETEEQLAKKAQILAEIADGTRRYDPTILQEVYGETMIGIDTEDDDDEEDAFAGGVGGEEGELLDATTLGTWTIEDIRSKFDYEWDPHGDEPDPNLVSLNLPNTRYVEKTPTSLDDPTVEQGYNPIFGPSSPIDRRTILGAKESFMINQDTRDETMLEPQFPEGDPELEWNEEVVKYRKSLDIIETYIDPFLPDMEIPRHVAKWHGYPEQYFFEPKPYTNNRFTDEQNRTNFDALTPHRARQKAVELARAKNAEWLPRGLSQQWHQKQREPYEKYQTLVGTLRKSEDDEVDSDVLEQIRPALQVFGSCVELLSVQEGVFRFAYHGLMKNRHGMTAWMSSLLAECGVEVTGVIMETGFRRRDPAYDGGDHWYGPIN